MITESMFNELIASIKLSSDNTTKLSSFGIDMSMYDDSKDRVIEILMQTLFGAEATENILAYVFHGVASVCTPAGNEIYDLSKRTQLWDYAKLSMELRRRNQ